MFISVTNVFYQSQQLIPVTQIWINSNINTVQVISWLITPVIFNVNLKWLWLKDTKYDWHDTRCNHLWMNSRVASASGWYLRFSTKYIANRTVRPVTNVRQSLATQTTCFSTETTQCSDFSSDSPAQSSRTSLLKKSNRQRIRHVYQCSTVVLTLL